MLVLIAARTMAVIVIVLVPKMIMPILMLNTDISTNSST